MKTVCGVVRLPNVCATRKQNLGYGSRADPDTGTRRRDTTRSRAPG